jgi:hypothetical protein
MLRSLFPLSRVVSSAGEEVFEDAHAFVEDEDIQQCPLKKVMQRLPGLIRA